MSTYEIPSAGSLTLDEQYIYGSSRLGLLRNEKRSYELTDHLGNVRSVVGELRDVNNQVEVISATDYYPFGMIAKSYNSNNYRYGFNGKEKDDEVKGSGNSYDYGDRIYDTRIARWLASDPAVAKFPSWSSYNFAYDNPIIFNDPDGQKPRVTVINNEDGSITIKITNTLFVVARGKQAKANPINPNEINKYLRSGAVKLGDKNVSIVIETQVIEVKNKREAITKIEENDGYGVIVNYDSRRLTSMLSGTGGRSYHQPAEETNSGYDELNILSAFSGPDVQAHELGHDLGFADKYVDVSGEDYSQCIDIYADGSLMGTMTPLSDYELAILATDVLYNNSLDVVNEDCKKIWQTGYL